MLLSDEKTMLTFGEYVRQQREARGLTRHELAPKLTYIQSRAVPAKMTHAYLRDVESGLRQANKHLIQQFATVLQLDEDWLYILAGLLPPSFRPWCTSQEQFRSTRERVVCGN